jgi:hypothetical protein
MAFLRISHDPAVMGGKPCIRGLPSTVVTILGLIASGSSRERFLQAYPLFEPADEGCLQQICGSRPRRDVSSPMVPAASAALAFAIEQ